MDCLQGSSRITNYRVMYGTVIDYAGALLNVIVSSLLLNYCLILPI